MNSIEKLIKKQVPFSVCVSTFGIKGMTEASKDYFIVIDDSDVKSDSNTPNNPHEIEMNNKDYHFFIRNKNLFNLVIKNEFGRVFEIKSKSFKKYHSAMNLNRKITKMM